MTVKCSKCGRKIVVKKSRRCECGEHYKIIDDSREVGE